MKIYNHKARLALIKKLNRLARAVDGLYASISRQNDTAIIENLRAVFYTAAQLKESVSSKGDK
jgi:hypothetical protein